MKSCTSDGRENCASKPCSEKEKVTSTCVSASVTAVKDKPKPTVCPRIRQRILAGSNDHARFCRIIARIRRVSRKSGFDRTKFYLDTPLEMIA